MPQSCYISPEPLAPAEECRGPGPDLPDLELHCDWGCMSRSAVAEALVTFMSALTWPFCGIPASTKKTPKSQKRLLLRTSRGLTSTQLSPEVMKVPRPEFQQGGRTVSGA